MPLPDLIEIVPLQAPVKARITVPGSKSITNRALVLAALAGGETVLTGALWSEDTQVMVECLQELGFMVNLSPDPQEPGNRTITVYGLGGRVPRGGTDAQPLELFVGNAGTAARFLTALVCLGQGVYRLSGVPRMHERPQAALFQALRQLGYRLDSPNDRLPALVHGLGPQTVSSEPARAIPSARTPSDRSKHAGTLGTSGRSCRVSIAESSQFASALLLCARTGGWQVEVLGENSEESPYVAMTRQLCACFPFSGGPFRIEPDASSGSYFWAAEIIQGLGFGVSNQITVADWPDSGWQVDAAFPKFWPLPATVSRQTDLGDSIMTAIVLASLGSRPVQFTDLGRLRLQECERVVALRTELGKCGGQVMEQGDTLEIIPTELWGAEIDTYGDHRMAMCFAILGLKVAGIKIKNPACVKKTFPNFFQKLAAEPPVGLGVTICDANGRRLGPRDLWAS
jgi:3-phosphoshikimate 1-carboxyvinyltransferase